MKFGVKRKFPPEKFADRTIKTKAIPTHDNIHPSCSHLNNLYIRVVTSPTYYRWYSLFVSLEFGDLFPESLHEVVMPRDERGHDHELVPRVVLADGQDGAHLVLDRGRQLQLQAPCPLHIKIYIIIEFIIKYIYIHKYNKINLIHKWFSFVYVPTYITEKMHMIYLLASMKTIILFFLTRKK